MPAGLSLAIDPAGEMWSVVTESPNAARHRAPQIGWIGGGDGAQLDEFENENIEAWEHQIFQGIEEFEGMAGDDTIDGADDPEAEFNPNDHALYLDSPNGVLVNLSDATVAGVGPNQAMDGFGYTDTLIDISGGRFLR